MHYRINLFLKTTIITMFENVGAKHINCLLDSIRLFFRNPKIFLSVFSLKESLKTKIRASCSIYQATKKGWIPKQLVKNEKLVLFKHRKLGITVFQPLINVLGEDLLSWINFIPKCRVLLDIGAFAGETAILAALLKQCKNVIAIEPAPSLWPVISKNVALNNLENAVLFIPSAIGDKDKSRKTLYSSYPPGTPGFGLIQGVKKSYAIFINTVSFSSLIRNFSPDVIKVDCEGCEKYLIDVPCNLITKAPIWIVETRGLSIQEKIVEHFFICGFTLAKWWKTSKSTTLFLFKKVVQNER